MNVALFGGITQNERYLQGKKAVLTFVKENHFAFISQLCQNTSECFSQGDILVFLPGGMDTLEALYAAIESKRRKEHDKQILIANIAGYFDNALIMIDKSICEGFTDETVQDLYDIVHTAEELSKYFYIGKK